MLSTIKSSKRTHFTCFSAYRGCFPFCRLWREIIAGGEEGMQPGEQEGRSTCGEESKCKEKMMNPV